MGKQGLRDLGFNIPVEGKVMGQQAMMLNRVGKELPSMSDVARTDDIELQEIMENAARSMENLIAQLEESEDLPMHKLLSLDTKLRSIQGSLKVETAKKVELQQCI